MTSWTSRKLCWSVLDMAIRNRDALGVVIDSAQFTSWAFTTRPAPPACCPRWARSVTTTAMIESFWGRVQTELLNRQRWRTGGRERLSTGSASTAATRASAGSMAQVHYAGLLAQVPCVRQRCPVDVVE